MLVVVAADFRIKGKILADRRIILSVPYPAKPGFRIKIKADNSRRFAVRHTRYRA